jgi:hypothetical protein
MTKKKNEDHLSSATKKMAKVMAVTMAVTPVIAVLPGVASAMEANEVNAANDVNAPGEVNAGNAATVVDVAEVADLPQLQAALANSQISTINVTADISGVEARIVVDRAVVINGGDHTISFTDAINTSGPGTRHGIAVQANGVSIKDLAVKMTPKDKWQGVYALQVYNATGVTLENFTGSGADAALLVNGSEVTLTGATTVSGNEFGGIEVSKGTAATQASKLTVEGTLVNGTEAAGKPTIWIVGDQGTVTKTGTPLTSKTVVKDGNETQTHYYLNALQLSSLEITTPPTKLTYNVGEQLDLTGLQVTGTYIDGSTQAQTVTAANVTGFNSAEAGDQTVTVTVGGKTVTFTVTVKAAATEAYTIGEPKVTVNGNVAKVTVTISKQTSSTEPVTVLFQLMDGNKPVQLITLKLDSIESGKELTGEFILPASKSYTVKVLLWDDLLKQMAKAQPTQASIPSNN